MSTEAEATEQQAPEIRTETLDFTKHENEIKEYLKSQGLAIKTPAEIQKEIDAAVGNTHTSWEAKLSTVLGEGKPDGVKGLDWAESQITKLKSKLEPAPETNKVANEVKSEVDKAALKALQEQVEALKLESLNEKKRASEITVNSEVRLAVKGLPINAEEKDLPERHRAAETLLKAKYEFKLDENNNVVPYENGSPLIDPDTQAPYSLSKLAEKDLAWMVKTEKAPLTGTGKQPPVQQVKSFRNIEEIISEAKAQGLVIGEQAYTDFLYKHAKANNIELQ